MNLRDRNLRLALLKAFADAVNEELANERAGHCEDLVTRYVDEGTKSFDVKLPDGTKVAAISLTIPKDKIEVADTDALGKWAEQNDTSLLTEIVHPAVPEHTVVVPAQEEWTEKVLDSKRVTELLGRLKPVDPAASTLLVDPDTGQVVDGVDYTPPADPKSFSVRYTDDGREHLGRAYRSGALSHLVGGTPLPAIEDGAS